MASRFIIIIALLISSLAASSQNGQTYEAGKLDSSIVYLDVDMFGNFHEGLCSVKKGDDIGFINEKGEYVIPLGKFQYLKDTYLLTEENMPRFSDGLCRVVKSVRDKYQNYNYRYGFINKKGRQIIDYKLGYLGNFANGFAYQLETGYFYDKLGNKVNKEPVWESHFIFPEGVKMRNFISHALVPAKMVNNNLRGKEGTDEYYTFYDISMEPIIKGKFLNAGLFSQGLAPVAVRDDSTGQVKWGYINELGETVIDYQFDYRPGEFSDSLAAVKIDSMNINGPKLVYINHQGEHEVIIPYRKGLHPQWTPLNFYNGWLLIWEGRGFKSYSRDKLIARGLKMKDVCGKYFYDIGRPIFPIRKIKDKYVLVSSAKSPCNVRGLIVYTLDGELLLPPIYNNFGPFGSESGLAKITYISRTRQSMEGFINTSGRFVILKGKGPN